MSGSGKTFYQPVYIDNLVDAYVLTLDEDTGWASTYLIGDAEYLPLAPLESTQPVFGTKLTVTCMIVQ